MRTRFFSTLNIAFGVLLYCVHVVLVAIFSYRLGPLAGPDVDAGQMAWIPFFVADFPWSVIFNGITFPSNSLGVFVYAAVVGLPWIIYGIAISWLTRSCISLIGNWYLSRDL